MGLGASIRVHGTAPRRSRTEPALPGEQTVMYRDIPEELRSLIEPIVQDFGFELVDVALHRGRSPWQLRITLDTPQGDGRVSVERCAEVSREIGTQLDAAD